MTLSSNEVSSDDADRNDSKSTELNPLLLGWGGIATIQLKAVLQRVGCFCREPPRLSLLLRLSVGIITCLILLMKALVFGHGIVFSDGARGSWSSEAQSSPRVAST